MNGFLQIFIISLFINNYTIQKGNNTNSLKIYYLHEWKLHSYDISSKKSKVELFNNDSLNYFTFSPSNNFLAYSRIIKNIKSSSEIRDRPICSIVIFDMVNKIKIKEIIPDKYEYISIDKWISNEQILYHSSDGSGVNGWLTYTIGSEIINLGYSNKQKEVCSIVYSNDFNTKLFVDSINVLHKINVSNESDIKIFQTKNQIYDVEISNNKNRVACFEIFDLLDSVTKKWITYDKISIINQDSSSHEEIYYEKAMGKFAIKCMKFSPSDSIICFELLEKMNHKYINKLILFNIYFKKRFDLEGRNLCWYDSNKIIFTNNDNMYLYSINEKTKILLVENAKYPIIKHYAR